MTRTHRTEIRPRSRSWSDPDTRALVWQVLVVAAVCGLVALFVRQAAINLKLRGIASGFGYLSRGAGFEIAPGVLAYSSRDTYRRALAVGVANTIRVSLLAIIVAVALGTLVGVARLSRIAIVSALARAYIEALRNTPLLLQLFFWYALSQSLPGVREALHPMRGVYLSNRGLVLPWMAWQGGMLWIDRPLLVGLNFAGGLAVSPEFGALLVGLSTYTSAFIAETVRGGVIAVDAGQTEAAAALGLSRWGTLRLVVFPQALPVILPPATIQIVSLVKNSSLAVAIGYPDLLSISNATLNQTGQAIEAIAVAMVVYLTIGGLLSFAMAACERRAGAYRGRRP